MSLIDDILTDALPELLKAAFGDSITYTHKPGNTAQTVTAIASDPDPAEPAYPGSTSILDILRSDLDPAAAQGDEIAWGSTTYTVVDVKADKIGPSGLFVRLALRKKP